MVFRPGSTSFTSGGAWTFPNECETNSLWRPKVIVVCDEAYKQKAGAAN
jgi:hypothetical protein